MKYGGTLLVSKDLAKTQEFYWNVLGLRKTVDFGTNITLKGGISFQTMESWAGFLEKDVKDIRLQGNDSELFFEEDDMDAFMEILKANNVELVHEMYEHEWGAKTIRFYDPDYHIIEVSESLPYVVKRFVKQGKSIEDIHEQTMLSVAVIKRMLRK